MPPGGPDDPDNKPAKAISARIVENDRGIVRIEIETPNGQVEAMAEMSKVDGNLTLRGLHIGGSEANTFTLSDIRAMARALGAQEGAETVTIEGGVRTSGANPGHTPRPIRIQVNP